MAQTAGIFNGTDFLVYDATNPITHSTTCSLSLSQNLRDTSSKSTAGWKAVLPAQRSWTIETSGMIALDATYNLAYLQGLIDNQTRVAVKFKTANVDNEYWEGYAYLTSVSVDAPLEANTTYSASFIGDGALDYVKPGA
jgi:predicted secreted protein